MPAPLPDPDAARRDRLAAQWQANEAELQRLADLPAGATDPAARERELDQRQDEIEGSWGRCGSGSGVRRSAVAGPAFRP